MTSSYLTSLALSGARSRLLVGSSEGWAAVPVLEVLHHLAVPLPLLLRVVLRQLDGTESQYEMARDISNGINSGGGVLFVTWR